MPDKSGHDPAGGWRHLGWSWTVKHGGVVQLGFGAFVLFLGGVLGFLPGLISGEWKSNSTWVQLWVAVGLFVLAVAAGAVAWTARRGRDRMIAQNGTAYIIQEFARFWDIDTAARFREGISRQFARVVQVPGPVELSKAWDWSLDEDAWDWDARADELSRAFRVLAVDEARGGTGTNPNGVFMWAYWPVAAAFGMRATAADKDLVLDVWQRRSNFRAGLVEPEIWAQRPHRFGSTAVSNQLPFEERVWSVGLESTWIPQRRGSARRRPGVGQVTVLLIRFSASEWGPLPPVLSSVPDQLLTLNLRTAVLLPDVGSSPVTIHELCCVPPLTASGDRQFPWEQFPALVAKATAWIEEKAGQLKDHTLLLGTLMPQEVGLGIGIQAGQASTRSRWPAELWPIVLDPRAGDLAIPHLQLGLAAVDPAHHVARGA